MQKAHPAIGKEQQQVNAPEATHISWQELDFSHHENDSAVQPPQHWLDLEFPRNDILATQDDPELDLVAWDFVQDSSLQHTLPYRTATEALGQQERRVSNSSGPESIAQKPGRLRRLGAAITRMFQKHEPIVNQKQVKHLAIADETHNAQAKDAIQEFGLSAYLSGKFQVWRMERRNTVSENASQRSELLTPTRRKALALGVLAVGAVAATLTLTTGSGPLEQLPADQVVSFISPTPEQALSSEVLSENYATTDTLFAGNMSDGSDIVVQQEPTAAPETEAVMPAEAPPTSLAIDNPAYNIPAAGTGEQLFKALDIDTSIWYAHAQELLAQFGDDFYSVDGDVRLVNAGWLSVEARMFIESLRP